MLKKVTDKLSEYPGIYTFLRKIIEFNFRTQRRIISRELKNPGKVLDVPCGIGEFSIFFDKECYIGMDLSEVYVDYAKKKHRKNFLVGDALNLNFSKDSFDSVLVSGFFHHLDWNQVEESIKEIKRVLREDGRVLLIEDAPSTFFISKKLQSYDVGANIRGMEAYSALLKKYFKIEKKYPVKSGFWDYSVFVLKK